MKQTAVEFLHSEYKRIFGDVLIKPNQVMEMADALNKAKEIEKEENKNLYSEEDLKQFAFECVGNFLSNRENELEIELVNVISDRNNKLFEKFKNK